jgi:putative NADH-flavin reductase
MKVLIAGATGAIGKPLLNCLDDAGHEILALVRTHKVAGTREAARAHEVVADALDAASVLDVVQHTKPDVIVNELTSLPKHYTPEEMKAARCAGQGSAIERQCKPACGPRQNDLPINDVPHCLDSFPLEKGLM